MCQGQGSFCKIMLESLYDMHAFTSIVIIDQAI